MEYRRTNPHPSLSIPPSQTQTYINSIAAGLLVRLQRQYSPTCPVMDTPTIPLAHCFWQVSDSVCTTVWPWHCLKKKKPHFAVFLSWCPQQTWKWFGNKQQTNKCTWFDNADVGDAHTHTLSLSQSHTHTRCVCVLVCVCVYVVCHGGTWALDSDGFLLRVFFLIFCFFRPCRPVPPLP